MSSFQPAQPFKSPQFKQQPPVIGKKAEVIVAMGGSTGSPKIIEGIFARLPADLPAAIMVSLHMPAGFTSSFADRLDQLSLLRVKEAAEKDILLQGSGLIAPGGYHLIVKMKAVALSSAPKVHFVRPAVDVMLESLAFSRFKVIAVILSGMGRDGTAGIKKLKIQKPDSIVIVQDPLSSVIASMPESVINSGFFDEVVPFSRIAGRITANIRALTQKQSRSE